MTTLDKKAIRQEIVHFVRNSDILSTTVRGVTTQADTGSFSAATSHIISRTNVKNIRSIVVGVTTLKYGRDYTVNFDYDNAGTIACRIAFASAQTGSYTITYDYGTDKIFPDWPRSDLTISSFPRISVDILDIPTSDAGFGGVLVSTINATIVAYDSETENLTDYMTLIRAAVFANKSNFWYFGKYVRVLSEGPIIKSPRESGKDKIFQQNIDVLGRFNYEQ